MEARWDERDLYEALLSHGLRARSGGAVPYVVALFEVSKQSICNGQYSGIMECKGDAVILSSKTYR